MPVFLFNKEKDPGRLPSTSSALKLHIRRADYQTTIWLNVTVLSPELIDAETCACCCKNLYLKYVHSCCNAAAKCVQQDGANVDLTLVISISAVLRLWFYYIGAIH